MAEDRDDSQKTEEPSAKRLQDALEKGDVAKSQDVVTWMLLATGTGLVALYAGSASKSFAESLSVFLSQPHTFTVDFAGALKLLSDAGWIVFGVLALPLLFFMAAGIAGNMLQHPPVFTAERLKPNFSKLSPMTGFKRLFGQEALVNFVKGLLKIGAIGAIGAYVLWPEHDKLARVMTLDPAAILILARDLSVQLLVAILSIFGIIAAVDFGYQRFAHIQKLRMSRQELREEFKQSEGDPMVRAKIRQVRLERSRRRMLAAVPTATAVIMNPTHYAVALAYESGKMAAPVCVAKGVDALALRIRDVAKEHNVPVIENPPLARALYATVEVDEPVKPEHYKAVAQVIGFVMRLKGKAGRGRR